MSIVPLFGHHELRARLAEAVNRKTLPSSLLLQGPRGVGKQRLALWLGQLLLCEALPTPAPPGGRPCGECQSCRFALALKHPDLHWYFPRPRLKDTGADLADVREDYAEALAERARDDGLYLPPSGSDGIYVVTVRAIVQQAAISPAMGKRKIFILGDAERMVPQEGADQAANAFLKLLEEPLADTTIVLTSSEPSALLPTVRSRVASLRVAPVAQDDLHEFLAHESVASRLSGDATIPDATAERVAFAGGAPGRLFAGELLKQARDNAQMLLDAVGKPSGGVGRNGGEARYEAAWAQSSAKARGSFADTLDALTEALHARASASARKGSEASALAAARAIDAVEVAKERVASNVSPQLITVNLIRELQELFT